ncbi:hypothetical protein KIN20_004905 [Parelaphostrongylus tenuis]|uniref:Uncharacterized protein n=1 Tax=Parelaphostrongylus tenuis TaxID=148309 RepID=A0AAD5MKE6_PARTN|nr:hypothetical protein KIN20_004905 [Parelaphostrongylus tenuis]
MNCFLVQVTLLALFTAETEAQNYHSPFSGNNLNGGFGPNPYGGFGGDYNTHSGLAVVITPCGAVGYNPYDGFGYKAYGGYGYSNSPFGGYGSALGSIASRLGGCLAIGLSNHNGTGGSRSGLSATLAGAAAGGFLTAALGKK